jgi:hypothetical protein
MYLAVYCGIGGLSLPSIKKDPSFKHILSFISPTYGKQEKRRSSQSGTGVFSL